MIAQGTIEWRMERAGKVTASRIADIIAKTKSGYSTSRENYLTELVIERFGVISDGFTNAAMQWGTETEPLARAAYELKNGVFVQEVGFIAHGSIDNAGASPDGMVGDDGMLEIKCPNSSTHFNYILEEKVPEKYKPQMAWQMASTGRKWVDFVSFDPRVPDGLQYFQIRYERDDEYIELLEREVKQFIAEVDERYAQLKEKMEKKNV